MKTTITAKKMQIPQSFGEYSEKKINAKLDKFFGDEADAKIIIAEHKNQIIIELTVRYNGIIYRAEQTAIDKEDALDACIDKIVRQIRKNKTKIEKRLKESAFKETIAEPIEDEQINYDVVKHKTFVLRPMDVEEAILQMNMLGHNFFVFLNAETGSTNVVYKRDEGNYSVLEPTIE
ncbi:MAG: ribosome-associated translation inhibitor RaiA [Ruminococcus sp.]|nr:ribosome-associated translation inhibitor RaiA [Ruminococcus sp.]MCD7799806.1 ribosome-associated translation inhibitor RaiA [Ruminococcus sp.]